MKYVVKFMRVLIVLALVIGVLHADPSMNFLPGGMQKTRDVRTDLPQVKSIARTKKTSRGYWKRVKPGKNNAQLKIRAVSVGNAKKVWAVGRNNRVYRLTKKGWKRKTNGIAVAAAADGTVVVIRSDKDVFKLVGKNRWKKIPDLTLDTISVAGKKRMWGISKKGDTRYAFKLSQGKWVPVRSESGSIVEGFVLFSVSPSGEIFALDQENGIYRRDKRSVKDTVKKKKRSRKKKKRKKKKLKKKRKKRKKKRVKKKKKGRRKKRKKKRKKRV